MDGAKLEDHRVMVMVSGQDARFAYLHSRVTDLTYSDLTQ